MNKRIVLGVIVSLISTGVVYGAYRIMETRDITITKQPYVLATCELTDPGNGMAATVMPEGWLVSETENSYVVNVKDEGVVDLSKDNCKVYKTGVTKMKNNS